MPFGAIFGALFFFLSAWVGVQFLSSSATPTKVGGLLLVLFGVSVGLGLLRRASWSRFVALGGAVGLGLFAVRMIDLRGSTIDLALLLSAVVTVVLLLVPATAPRTESEAATTPRRGTGRILPGVATISAAGLLAVAGWLWAAKPTPVSADPALTAGDARSIAPVAATQASGATEVAWTDFGSGLERARRENRPMLVSFVAEWCGYCDKMDRETWAHPSVVAQARAFVPVEVDIDDQREVNGFAGIALAGRYRVEGTPTTMVIGADGQVLAQAGGFLTARQLLPWLEESLSRVSGGALSNSAP